MATYDLDVAFSSDVTPNDPTVPVAMAYGFTDNAQGGVFKGRGQTKDNVQTGDTVNFYVYDTAPSPTYNVTSVQVSAVNKSHGANGAKSPFSDAAWANGSITATNIPGAPVQLNGPNSPALSTGCNVKGKSWGIGPFTVANLQGQQKFEITVTVLTQNAQQSQKSFTVDPEVVVGTEGK